jgi:hypothetical protein
MTTAPRDWAQGSLRVISPSELLSLAARRKLTGRLALFSASTPRRVAALHLDKGRPVLAVGTGLHGSQAPAEERYRARQVVLEALGWTVGSFRLETMPVALPADTEPQDLGTADNLLLAARERAQQWPAILRRLPAPYEEVVVHPANLRRLPEDSVGQAIVQVLDRPRPLRDLGPRCGVDEHVVAATVMHLAKDGTVRLASGDTPPAIVDPASIRLARLLGMTLAPSESSTNTFKITVLSWDSKTCFRMVEALLGRFKTPPPNIEEQPRFSILHETSPLPGGQHLEVLAFRADAFEPTFAAPLVQNSHLFLLVTDMEAGHVWGAERPLVDRIQEIRSMFSQAAAAGRITVGAGAVTDPGCDVLIPELGRYTSWEEIQRSGFLGTLLKELAERLGLELEELTPPAGKSSTT